MTLVFLASVLVLMYADGGAGRTTVLCLPLIVAALVAAGSPSAAGSPHAVGRSERSRSRQ